ncbi:hypothetical protein, partial [Chryseobacterium sp. MFBS3-17]|uniref:hypothetical protein n=1 Tax=Chryseobacterium sp. MFBS3-17 TaxID=2886689 RepID=UPI001D0EECDB
KWISRLGNAGGNYYTGMGGAGLGGSSPFFRPDIDQVINTYGYFGAMLNSLSISSFKSGMDRLEAFLGLSQQAVGLADAAAGIGGEQKSHSFYGTVYTGTELIRNPEGQVNGVKMTSQTRYINNLTGFQRDSIKSKNTSDSLRGIRDMQRRSDSLRREMLRR